MGATTVRRYVLGNRNKQPSESDLNKMKKLVKQAMEEGALGLSSALIYPPAGYAKTEELIELAKIAAEYQGIYISHIRSEGDRLLEAADELIRIATEAGIPAEFYHLKAAGRRNWDKQEKLIEKIDSANSTGLSISTNMYLYTAASTGIDVCIPPWAHNGGKEKMFKKFKDEEIRTAITDEMSEPYGDYENFLQLAGPENVLLLGFNNDTLDYLIGKTVEEVAEIMELSPAEAIVKAMIMNGEDIDAVYFLMSEQNVRKLIRLPYMSFVSDARSIPAEGVHLKSSTHPRTYGNFARLLGKYVRDEQVIPMEEALWKLTGLPAKKLQIEKRGILQEGNYADIVIFDPQKIRDKATYENPHQYSEGVIHVFVNGVQVLENGEHTEKFPGRFVRGVGYKLVN